MQDRVDLLKRRLETDFSELKALSLLNEEARIGNSGAFYAEIFLSLKSQEASGIQTEYFAELLLGDLGDDDRQFLSFQVLAIAKFSFKYGQDFISDCKELFTKTIELIAIESVERASADRSLVKDVSDSFCHLLHDPCGYSRNQVIMIHIFACSLDTAFFHGPKTKAELSLWNALRLFDSDSRRTELLEWLMQSILDFAFVKSRINGERLF